MDHSVSETDQTGRGMCCEGVDELRREIGY